MRRRDTDLQARVNRDLAFEFGDVRLTSYAGLELFSRYLRAMRFNDLDRAQNARTTSFHKASPYEWQR